jgi:hypothetical protein
VPGTPGAMSAVNPVNAVTKINAVKKPRPPSAAGACPGTVPSFAIVPGRAIEGLLAFLVACSGTVPGCAIEGLLAFSDTCPGTVPGCAIRCQAPPGSPCVHFTTPPEGSVYLTSLTVLTRLTVSMS